MERTTLALEGASEESARVKTRASVLCETRRGSINMILCAHGAALQSHSHFHPCFPDRLRLK